MLDSVRTRLTLWYAGVLACSLIAVSRARDGGTRQDHFVMSNNLSGGVRLSGGLGQAL